MRTLTPQESRTLAEQARAAVRLVARRGPEWKARDAELDALAAAALPFPHAVVAPASARLAGIDGSGASPVLEHEARVIHGIVVACARFDAEAGRRGLRGAGVEIETGLHVEFAGERASPDASAACIRASAEWALAAQASRGERGADVVLLDARFAPLGSSRALRDDADLMCAYAASVADAHDRALVAISKRLGLPHLGELERRIAARGLRDHWRVRVPCRGAVAWLARFHATTLRVEVTSDLYGRRFAGGDASAETAFFALLDHASHADAAPGYPYPLRAAHEACTVDGRARALLAAVVGAEARRLAVPRDAVVGAGARSGHAPRRGPRAARVRRLDAWRRP